MSPNPWMAIHTGSYYCLDHLAPLCEGLNIPLLVTEPLTYEIAQQFYPYLQVKFVLLSELTPYFFATAAEAFFVTSHHFASEVIPLAESVSKKPVRFIYCPHGNSDKKEVSYKDISLVYGHHMLSLLKQEKELSRLYDTIFCGNYRYASYLASQTVYDMQLKNYCKSSINPFTQTVLYAPTWPYPDQLPRFMKTAIQVITQIAPHYNLWIKWHPLFEERFPVEHEKLQHLSSSYQSITDLSFFPRIYPILHHVHFYVGDFSSVGYDFLTFNKPLFFTQSQEGKIYSCGVQLHVQDDFADQIANFQDHITFQKQRAKLKNEVFKKNITWVQIREDIRKALLKGRALWNEFS